MPPMFGYCKPDKAMWQNTSYVQLDQRVGKSQSRFQLMLNFHGIPVCFRHEESEVTVEGVEYGYTMADRRYA